ncbi:MAG: trypsin-like peptidase domain-containing protein [Myxococcota bacterium]
MKSLSTLALATGLLATPAFAQRTPAPRQEAAQSAESIRFAQALGDAFATVAERSSPSVVSIRVEAQRRPAAFGMGGGTVRGGGSGVIFSDDGLILTNNHVVGSATAIQVRLHDGRTFPAEIVGTDAATDLALIRIEATDLPAATFASRSSIRVGEWAIAVGSPFGLDYTVTAGIVSAIGRAGVGMNEIEDYIQTDASINPGNSGGPLLNLRGEVIGINTMIVGRGSGIGFAVTSELAERVATQLASNDGRVRRAYIGVSFQDLTPDLAAQIGVPQNTRGALVAGIDPDGPSASSNLRTGDIITHVNGTALTATGDLIRRVLAAPIGSTLRVRVLREGRSRGLRLQTAERPSRDERARRNAPEPDRYGLSLQNNRRGVRVLAVQPQSIAGRAGLMMGDLIVEADRRHVRRARDVHRALRDGEALLRVVRGRGALFISIRGASAPSR